MRRKLKISLFLVGFMTALFFMTTCDMPMGLGDPIDWEPPTLNLSGGTVRYISNSTVLEGTVYDNGRIARVVFVGKIIHENGSEEEITRSASISGNTWRMTFNFPDEYNGKKIIGEIIAYDSFGNSGETGIVSVQLIVDTLAPFLDDIWVQRTSTRRADLETYSILKALEGVNSDPQGLKSGNVELYQNGKFWISATLREGETKIVKTTLEIYDESNKNVLLHSIELNEANWKNLYSPQFTVDAEDLIAAGEAKSWANYRSNYNNGTRYYYFVKITAQDQSANTRTAEGRHFCLWKNSDTPKGFLDPIVGKEEPITVTRGSSLPVEFFDDDIMDAAYAALFTIEQWGDLTTQGSQLVNTGTRIPAGTGDQKYEWVKNRLIAGTATYDWRAGRANSGNGVFSGATNRIDNLVGSGMEKLIQYVETGNDNADYGEFVLVTVVRDKKSAPHDTPADTAYPAQTSGHYYRINVIDENEPLIVFDKTPNADSTPGSPEENTAPKLVNGQYFTIKGYTLRDNTSKLNYVKSLRMAWIPKDKINETNIAHVIAALKTQGTISDASFNAVVKDHVQWWEFAGFADAGNRINLDKSFNPASGNDVAYVQQKFTKRFDVLGGTDDKKTAYKNFYSDCNHGVPCPNDPVTVSGRVMCRENDTKLFIFCAEDDVGHQVTTQLYLLGITALPTISVYDFTGKTALNSLNPPRIEDFILTSGADAGVITDTVRADYRAALKTYQSTGFNIFKNSGLVPSPGDLTEPLKAYPRDTRLNYWVTAVQSGDLKLKSLSMQDITYSDYVETGYFDSASMTLSYTERLPEVTQRTFLFTATDTLGNVNRVQRTAIVTNAAVLTEITTTSQDGTYGVGKVIEMRARFSSQIRWTGNDAPLLNVRYKNNGVDIIKQIPTSTLKNTPTLYLSFPFEVAEWDGGKLETLFNGISGAPAPNVANHENRPIRIPTGTRILDDARSDDAFTPGNNTSGFDWLTDTGSLQKTKNIQLDGVYPKIANSITIIGKAASADGWMYFKTGDILTFTLPTDKAVYTGGNGNPQLQFTLTRPTGSTTFNATADYQRTTNNGKDMVFVATVASGIGDGNITAVRLLNNNGTIADHVDNILRLQNGNAITVGQTGTTLTYTGQIRIDQTPPLAPAVTVNGAAPTVPGTNNVINYYNVNPVLYIPPVTNTSEPWGVEALEYSLDDGLTWTAYMTAKTGGTVIDGSDLRITSGSWILQTRYRDMAGNEGATTRHNVFVNGQFPRLVTITAVEGNGTYRTGRNLNFNLTFDNKVYTTDVANVTVTLTNRNSTNAHNSNGGTVTDSTGATVQTGDNSFQRTLRATAITQANAGTTVSFAWNGITGKEMLDGMYVSAVNFGGLRDIYGNTGGTGTTTFATANQVLTIGKQVPGTSDNLNGAAVIVDCIDPRQIAMSPTNAEGTLMNNRSGSVMADNRQVILTFSEPVQAGMGTITIKPHGAYMIPPVFENDGYYLNVNTMARQAAPADGFTYIAGFYDIYNNGALIASDRTTLTAGTNMGNGLATDPRTGQSAGPYVRLTHGLKQGAGYTGNYNNNMQTAEFNSSTFDGPNPVGTTYMIPDTSTKWVLDYRYSIDNAQNTQIVASADAALSNASATVVPAIRAVLTKAKFRWQELDVVASTSYSVDKKTVTIKLNEPLENGLEWDICYPAGAFTDIAGNSAAALNYTAGANPTVVGETGSSHWFVSKGAQIPVIRVNRKSSDARTSNWGNTGGNGPTATANPTNRNGPGGWGMGDFKTVHYRIETETPGATIRYGTINGRDITANGVSIGSMWITTEDDVQWTSTTYNPIPSGGTASNTQAANWDTQTVTRGSWVRPNYIRRTSNNGTNYYTVTENGVQTRRDFKSNGNNHYYGGRSYNRDATIANLDAVTLGGEVSGPVSSGTGLNFTYYATEARKDYVVASTRVNYGAGNVDSGKGYEGVFRSVMAMRSPAGNADIQLVEGSNVKNGMPSYPGFPVRDAEESGDHRYVKVFYRLPNNNASFYWVSTEIVSQWYFIKFDSTSRHMTVGDANNYIVSSYGDLTYGYQLRGN